MPDSSPLNPNALQWALPAKGPGEPVTYHQHLVSSFITQEAGTCICAGVGWGRAEQLRNVLIQPGKMNPHCLGEAQL